MIEGVYVWWAELTTLEDLYKLVQFEKLVQPDIDCLTIKEYVSWFDMGLKITVLKESDMVWKGSYQLIDNGEGDIIFAGFGRHPAYKGKGVGQVLMNRLLTRSTTASLVCETRRDNYPMIRLLEANGFLFTGDEFKEGDHWTWWKRTPRGG